MVSWGKDLDDRTRSGGANAEKGFNFQKAYALVRLTWLPTGERGLVELRYEGAQDVDLRFGDGQEVFVQAKDYQSGGVTLDVLYDIIAGFARDIITIRASGNRAGKLPNFRVVCTSAPDKEKALELVRGVYSPVHAKAIAPLITGNYRKGFDDDEVAGCVLDALQRTTFEIIAHDSAILDLKAQASWNLARLGVPVEHVPASLSRLHEALVPRECFQIGDVVEHLVGLPEGHPGKDDAACRFLRSSRRLPMTPMVRTEFLRGSMQSLWCAVANDLDVHRAEYADVVSALEDISDHGGMVVAEGAGGTGKSTLVRRIAWDAMRSGSHLVLEVPAPGDVNEATWNAIVALLRFAERPVLLVVDDVWRHQTFIEELDGKVRHRLCVLATSRPGEKPHVELPRLLVHNIRLGSLSREVVEELRRLIHQGRSDRHGAKDGQITRLAKTGQLLALSLTLQSGSLSQFAKGILLPLKMHADMLDDFLNLCVAGRYDHTAPLSLFERSKRGEDRFWQNESFSGLASVQSGVGARRLRVGHAVVAQAIIEAAGIDLVHRMLEMCERCDPAILEERRFVVRLLLTAVADESSRADFQANVRMLLRLADRLLPEASFADAHRLAVVLQSCGQADKADVFLRAATPDRIRDIVDIGLAISRQTPDEFAELYPAILSFFDRVADAPGRRRFVVAVLKQGNSEQQIEVADQTAKWLVQNSYLPEETYALFVLAAGASGKDVASRIVPVLRSYLDSDDVTIDVLPIAVHLAKVVRDKDISWTVSQKSLKLIEATKEWDQRHIHLARMIVGLVKEMPDEDTRLRLLSLLLRMHGQVTTIRTKKSILRGAIVTAPLGHIGILSNEIASLKKTYVDGEMDEIEIHFHRHFKLGRFSNFPHETVAQS
ncbi:P-loop NTPase [Burkholderia cenocepacia]|uniref:P-loop NTPase n=1 Tax=Burkholderia cenocepacia TaxID=95486 RepID=UPI00285DD32B|nr:hypothetical protein [Burkholderia cenocepacia]MDR8071035.1 hypothetical protein [Burkholderia cenocepacia]